MSVYLPEIRGLQKQLQVKDIETDSPSLSFAYTSIKNLSDQFIMYICKNSILVKSKDLTAQWKIIELSTMFRRGYELIYDLEKLKGMEIENRHFLQQTLKLTALYAKSVTSLKIQYQILNSLLSDHNKNPFIQINRELINNYAKLEKITADVLVPYLRGK